MAGADPRDRSDTADRTDAGLSSGSDCFVVCVGALPAWPLSRRLIPVAGQGGARWTIWSRLPSGARPREHEAPGAREARTSHCLLYTSDAADDLLCVDLGGRRI